MGRWQERESFISLLVGGGVSVTNRTLGILSPTVQVDSLRIRLLSADRCCFCNALVRDRSWHVVLQNIKQKSPFFPRSWNKTQSTNIALIGYVSPGCLCQGTIRPNTPSSPLLLLPLFPPISESVLSSEFGGSLVATDDGFATMPFETFGIDLQVKQRILTSASIRVGFGFEHLLP